METQNNAPSLYQLADEFIHLANDLAGSGDQSTVGMAIRYAAARYNIFEATTAGYDLKKDKEKIMEMLVNDYHRMLEENLEDYAKQLG
jgi:hypothetical protein